MGVCEPESKLSASALSLLVALGLHGGILLLSPRLLEASVSSPTMVELEFAPLPSPALAPEPAPVEAAPVREPKAATSQHSKVRERAADPPPAPELEAHAAPPLDGASEPAAGATGAPAAAPAILTGPDAPQVPTGMVSGTASSGAGSSHTGNGSGPGLGRAEGHGQGERTVAGGALPVKLATRQWNCPWPAQAEGEDIQEQLVPIRVLVAETGLVERVEVLADPGYGFGAAARQCARQARFTSARDAQGRAVRAQSPPIHVRFVR